MSDAGVTVSDIPAAGPPRAHKSSRLPGWIWLVGTIALLWVLIAGVEAALVAVHVHRGTAQVDEARRQLAPEDLKSGAALPALRRAGAADRAAGATSAMADLLSGRRYLVLAANNAEMRAGSGMFLSVGVLESSAGAFHLGPVRPSADFDLPGDGVALGGTLAERWGWLHPNREWRNLGLSPQFDETGPLAARMWQAAQGQPIDGVLAVDVEALKTMLSVTGPVATDRGEVSAGNVEPL